MNKKIKLLWLTETIRQIEQEAGAFNDDEANRQAQTVQGDDNKLFKRAEVIASQHGLLKTLNEWMVASKIALFILMILAIFAGAGMAFTALSQQPVNLYWAITSLLGLHLITFTIWIITCFFLPMDSGSLLIQIWYWLTKKIVRKKTVKELFPAYISLFGKNIRWLIGLVVNGLWVIIFFSALIVLIALLTTKNYSFEWQTTLLSADNIISLTSVLGKIPQILGFTIPDIEVIRSSANALTYEQARSAWAIWLLGVFVVYGLLVRLSAMILCASAWIVTNKKVKLNINHQEHQQVLQKLSTNKAVIDRQSINLNNMTDQTQITLPESTLNVLLAIDMEEEWLPPDDVTFIGFVNNANQRKTVLDTLQYKPANKLLIAIDTDRTPDRGLSHLLMQFKNKSHHCHVWFINHGRQYENWVQTANNLNIKQSDSDWLKE
ncbi:DUF2868 domain-containing protein [Orbaceae bacterium ac157xtp]